ncbi:MAG: FtsQ-type POTRA domain-containing protein [Treponema sp.]|jgi:cell division protein FtsQ|nr:FtsQ-type POTRA domain-containing protein [Treponema sp.]
MSTDYTYAACNDVKRSGSAGVSSDNKILKSAGKTEKNLKRLLLIAAALLAAELIWLFGISPFIPFSNVEIHSFDGFGRADVLMAAGIQESSSFISINAKEAEAKLAGNLLVESAKVIKRFPDKLSIYLSPRKAAAVALTTTGMGQQLIFIDRNGIFFKICEEDGTPALPVISGLELAQLNMRLPAGLVPLTESLYTIAQTSPELLAAVSEIRIERKAWDGFELVVFPVHSSSRVRLENSLTEDILRYMLLMLNVFENGSHPQEIDFRSGMGSYKIKEQS